MELREAPSELKVEGIPKVTNYKTGKRPLLLSFLLITGLIMSPIGDAIPLIIIVAIGIIPAFYIGYYFYFLTLDYLIEVARQTESARQNGKNISGYMPKRDAYFKALLDARNERKGVLDKYLLGFNSLNGEPIWLSDQSACSHGYILSQKDSTYTKTAWLESLILQQLTRGRVSGCTFIDTKHDSNTLSHLIFIAMITGKIDDVIIIDPTNSLHSYNFIATNESAEIKAKKILSVVSLIIHQQFINPHLNRLLYDTVSRIVRAIESTNRSWSIKDLASVLSDFESTYPTLKEILQEQDAWKSVNELEEISVRIFKDKDAHHRHREILNAIKRVASILESLTDGFLDSILCTQYTDLSIKEAIISGKLIYFYLPYSSERICAQNLHYIIYSDLECAISEIVQTKTLELDDPHFIIVDEDSSSSTRAPSITEWIKLCDTTKDSKFSFIFGAVADTTNDSCETNSFEDFQRKFGDHLHFKITLEARESTTSVQHFGYPHSQQLWPQAVLQFSNERVLQINPLLFEAILPHEWSGREFISCFDHISRDALSL